MLAAAVDFLAKGQPGTGSLADELVAWWVLSGRPLLDHAVLPGLMVPFAQVWASSRNPGSN